MDSLIGLDREALKTALIAAGVPQKSVAMRVNQLWNWIYVHGAKDFAAMTNLAKDFRTLLEGSFTLERPEIVTAQVSEDGTRKWLLKTGAGIEFETVYIPEEGPRHPVRLLPGGLHPELPLLPHRHPEAGAQSAAVRNPGPALDRQGRAGGLAFDGAGPQGHQHGDDGDGRALYNFDHVKGGAGHCDGRRCAGALTKRRVTPSTAGVV